MDSTTEMVASKAFGKVLRIRMANWTVDRLVQQTGRTRQMVLVKALWKGSATWTVQSTLTVIEMVLWMVPMTWTVCRMVDLTVQKKAQENGNVPMFQLELVYWITKVDLRMMVELMVRRRGSMTTTGCRKVDLTVRKKDG